MPLSWAAAAFLLMVVAEIAGRAIGLSRSGVVTLYGVMALVAIAVFAVRRYRSPESDEERRVKQWLDSPKRSAWVDEMAAKAEAERLRSEAQSPATPAKQTQPESVGARLFDIATGANLGGGEEHALWKSAMIIARSVRTPLSQVQLELFAVKVHGVHYATFEAMESTPDLLKRTLQDVYDRVPNERQYPLSGDDLLSFVHARRKAYAGAMAALSSNEALDMLPPEAPGLNFNGQPPHDVGALFAHFCGAPSDPMAAMTGATSFTEAVQSTRAIHGRREKP